MVSCGRALARSLPVSGLSGSGLATPSVLRQRSIWWAGTAMVTAGVAVAKGRSPIGFSSTLSLVAAASSVANA